MDTPVKSLRERVAFILDSGGHWNRQERRILCTAVPGCYGTVAYWIIVLEGSPPKGSLIIQNGWNPFLQDDLPPAYFLGSNGRAKKAQKRSFVALNELIANLNHLVEMNFDAPRCFELRESGLVEVHTSIN